MSWYRFLGVLVLATLVLGCSQGSRPVRVQGPSPAENAKKALQEVVNTGEVGSGLADVDTYLTDLKKTDAAKADALQKDLTALQASGGKADQAKAKAKEMMDKL